MIDWKRVAKHLFADNKVGDRIIESNWAQMSKLADALARALGTPRVRECHVSYHDMVALAFQKLDEAPPNGEMTDRNIAETRFEQFVRAYKRGQKFDLSRLTRRHAGGCDFPQWKADLIHTIMESPDEKT